MREVLQWMNPENIIQLGGFTMLLVIVFLETGIFFGFFLPGDSLLFTAGFLCNIGVFDVQMSTLIICLVIASVLGTWAGYLSGSWLRKMGRRGEDTFLFKRRYLVMARQFYQSYGGLALVAGKFLPVIRTFLPILAGVVCISWRRFLIFNVLGSMAWVMVMVFSGYYMGSFFPGLHDHLIWVILTIILLTLLPALLAVVRKFFKKSKYRTSTHG